MNIKMSQRMLKIAEMVTPGKCVADIGCDHGFISMYLVEKGIAPSVIAMDVAEGPLASARENISNYRKSHISEASGNCDDKDLIELRISDGFEALKPGETDAAVIAGMGGRLIISILEKSLHNVIFEGYELILSPQSEQSEVRHFLKMNGFRTIDEYMLIEDGKYYNIIKAVYIGTDDGRTVSDEKPCEDKEINAESKETDIESEETDVASEEIDVENKETVETIYEMFGEQLIRKNSPVLRQYLINEMEKKEKLFCRLSGKQTDSTINRLASLRSELNYIEKALQMMNE